MIYDAIRMAGYDEAAPAGNGSDTDGAAVKAVGLPMSVMSLHVHLFASDHSEMASYIDRCLSCFFALLARALFKLNYTEHLLPRKCSVSFREIRTGCSTTGRPLSALKYLINSLI